MQSVGPTIGSDNVLSIVYDVAYIIEANSLRSAVFAAIR